ncbi:uncharacterized protein LOC142343142 [Convolutriloba macropyga]|uniref:uncharacterized protein LOC142343142 n=1 Tax=Convolutriloba macropyga TaxID=536237 RepID=UPI003F526158
MMQMFIQKMNRVKTIVYHWRSYSSIVNNLFANSQTLKCLIETDIDPLPSFSSLSDCIKGAHAASNFSLLRRNRSQSFSVALFEDARSVNEELSTIVHYSGERISINGRKYWIWYPSEEKPESVLLALLSDNGAQLSIEMPISETIGAIQTTIQSYDASLLCCHLQIDVKGFPMNELNFFEESLDSVNEIRQLYWFNVISMLLNNAREDAKERGSCTWSVSRLNDFMSKVYLLESMLSLHHTHLSVDPRNAFIDSVALKCFGTRLLNDIYSLLGEKKPAALNLLPNFYGNNDTLLLHSSRRVFKELWMDRKEILDRLLPDHESTNLNPIYSPMPDREAVLKAREYTSPSLLLSRKTDPFISPELEKTTNVCYNIDSTITDFRTTVFRALKNKREDIFFNHYLQKHLMLFSHNLFAALCVLKRLNDSYLEPGRFSNKTQLAAERAWAFKCIESLLMDCGVLAFKVTRSDIEYKNTQTNTQGKRTSTKRELQFVHALFPAFV